MSENIDDIEKILSDFKAQKSNRHMSEAEPLAPPVKREELIDFSKPKEEAEEKEKEKQKKDKKPKKEKIKKPEKSAEEKSALKEKRTKKLKKTIKATGAVFLAAVIVVSCFFAVRGIVDYSKTAYLKPYEKAYPNVEFPTGILEKYCDDYGKNPDLVGYLQIKDIADDKLLSDDCEALTDGAERYNYTVYLETNELEERYKNADLYNSSDKTVYYSDLFEDYTFQVLGAFYTNTKPQDDDGYIFPYNTTEKMVLKSANEYIDRIKNRLLYHVDGIQLTRQDTLLTISCPTDYRENYRFVLVCKAVDNIKSNATATENTKARKTAIEYEENNERNPYRFASKWYPEIIVKDENNTEHIIKKTLDDYK